MEKSDNIYAIQLLGLSSNNSTCWFSSACLMLMSNKWFVDGILQYYSCDPSKIKKNTNFTMMHNYDSDATLIIELLTKIMYAANEYIQFVINTPLDYDDCKNISSKHDSIKKQCATDYVKEIVGKFKFTLSGTTFNAIVDHIVESCETLSIDKLAIGALTDSESTRINDAITKSFSDNHERTKDLAKLLEDFGIKKIADTYWNNFKHFDAKLLIKELPESAKLLEQLDQFINSNLRDETKSALDDLIKIYENPNTYKEALTFKLEQLKDIYGLAEYLNNIKSSDNRKTGVYKCMTVMKSEFEKMEKIKEELYRLRANALTDTNAYINARIDALCDKFEKSAMFSKRANNACNADFNYMKIYEKSELDNTLADTIYNMPASELNNTLADTIYNMPNGVIDLLGEKFKSIFNKEKLVAMKSMLSRHSQYFDHFFISNLMRYQDASSIGVRPEQIQQIQAVLQSFMTEKLAQDYRTARNTALEQILRKNERDINAAFRHPRRKNMRFVEIPVTDIENVVYRINMFEQSTEHSAYIKYTDALKKQIITTDLFKRYGVVFGNQFDTVPVLRCFPMILVYFGFAELRLIQPLHILVCEYCKNVTIGPSNPFDIVQIMSIVPDKPMMSLSDVVTTASNTPVNCINPTCCRRSVKNDSTIRFGPQNSMLIGYSPNIIASGSFSESHVWRADGTDTYDSSKILCDQSILGSQYTYNAYTTRSGVKNCGHYRCYMRFNGILVCVDGMQTRFAKSYLGSVKDVNYVRTQEDTKKEVCTKVNVLGSQCINNFTKSSTFYKSIDEIATHYAFFVNVYSFAPEHKGTIVKFVDEKIKDKNNKFYSEMGYTVLDAIPEENDLKKLLRAENQKSRYMVTLFVPVNIYDDIKGNIANILGVKWTSKWEAGDKYKDFMQEICAKS